VDHTLEELSALTDTSGRTVRYYIQLGLVDRPVGSRKTARYSQKHIEQLLTVKKWQAAGLSLDAIQRILQDETPEPKIEVEPGTISVRSLIQLAPGIELSVDPQKSKMDTDQIRNLSKQILKLIQNTTSE